MDVAPKPDSLLHYCTAKYKHLSMIWCTKTYSMCRIYRAVAARLPTATHTLDEQNVPSP